MASSFSWIKRISAGAEVLLIFPASLFMTALFVRNVQPQQYEPAHSAQRIVTWYAARPWTLWLFLMAFPLAVLVTGCATLRRSWRDDIELRGTARHTLAAIRMHLATVLVAAATLAAAGILAIVAVHSVSD
ncbi:MAG: hypothetical protein ABI408_08085 [Gemmatimonadaceae bacterium]